MYLLLFLGFFMVSLFFMSVFLFRLLLPSSSSSSSSVFYFVSVTKLLLSHPTGFTFLGFSHPFHQGRARNEETAAGYLVAGSGKMQQYQNMSISYDGLSPQKNCIVTKKEKPGENLHCGRPRGA